MLRINEKKEFLDFLIKLANLLGMSDSVFELQHYKGELMFDRCNMPKINEVINKI